MITKDEVNTNFYSMKGAAQHLGVSVRRVGQLLKEGRLADAFMFEGVWLIPKLSVDNFQRKPQGNFTNHRRTSDIKREVSQWLEAAGYSPKKGK